MSREAKYDLQQLRSFVAKYSLKSVSSEAAFDGLLVHQHQKYLALLTILAEICHQRSSATSAGRQIEQFPTTDQILYLNEAVSDIGHALFNWIHGAYKSSRIMLRSSIETFVKGMSCAEFPTILIERSTYKVFEVAATTNFFRADGDALLKELNMKYGELSADVHSARVVNMSHVSALNHFPAFKSSNAKKAGELLVYIATRQLYALSLAFNACFHEMHHRNREIVIEAIPKGFRRKVYNAE